jgi:hypothetical protein
MRRQRLNRHKIAPIIFKVRCPEVLKRRFVIHQREVGIGHEADDSSNSGAVCVTISFPRLYKRCIFPFIRADISIPYPCQFGAQVFDLRVLVVLQSLQPRVQGIPDELPASFCGRRQRDRTSATPDADKRSNHPLPERVHGVCPAAIDSFRQGG